jgi:phage shock protein PspC (stress-responsive transcriptional regulator)
MTSTPPDAPPDGPGAASDDRPHDERHDQRHGQRQDGPRVSRDEVRDLGRLRRTSGDRRVAGVAGGLARHLDIDPVILRVAFVVLVFFGGAGLVLYVACWLLVPSDDRERAPLALDDRNRGIALLLVGVLAVLLLLGDTWGERQWLGWQLTVVGVVALLVISRRSTSTTPRTPRTAAGTEAGAAPALAESPALTAPAPAGPATAPAPWPAYQPPVRSPRKRGPILFWFTLALVALAEGLLGIADLAGAPVADAAYPALAVATIGAMLLVGAFYGRAGGLVLVGLVASLALGLTTAAADWESDDLRRAPVQAADVQDAYRISTGEMVLDLRGVRDLDGLDGRTLQLRGDLGRIEVVVPAGLDVDVSARVDGPGDIALFGEDHGGIDLAVDRRHDGGSAVPALTLDAQLDVGQIEVHE